MIVEFRVIRQSSLKVRCEIREAKAEEPVKTSRSLQRRASSSVSHKRQLWKFCNYSDTNICWHRALRWLPHHRDSPVISGTRSLSVKPDKLIPSQGPQRRICPLLLTSFWRFSEIFAIQGFCYIFIISLTFACILSRRTSAISDQITLFIRASIVLD